MNRGRSVGSFRSSSRSPRSVEGNSKNFGSATGHIKEGATLSVNTGQTGTPAISKVQSALEVFPRGIGGSS